MDYSLLGNTIFFAKQRKKILMGKFNRLLHLIN